MPWIHLHDLTEVLAHACTDQRYHGVVNGVAPQAVTNATFAQTLGNVLHRPAWVPAPAWGLRVALGEAADFLLFSHNVTSRLGPALGYTFQYPTLQATLAQILRSGNSL